MIDALQRRARQEMEASLADLRPEEAAVMALLQNRLARGPRVRENVGVARTQTELLIREGLC